LLDGTARREVRTPELIERATQLAKRFGLSVHAGVASKQTAPFPARRYEAALAAAEQALASGRGVVQADHTPSTNRSLLAVMRRELREAIVRNPALLSARFQRYLAAVSARYAYRLEPVRAQLEAAFDQISDAIEATGTLDAKSLAELRANTEKEAAETDVVSELSEVYRRGVVDLEQALLQPKEAAKVRSLRRCLVYMRDHYGDDLTRAKLAKIAGFAEHSFSRAFAKSEGMTYQKYLKRLRIERAKQMLHSTSLSVERVGQHCGFRTRVQFHKAFKQTVGKTPRDYRERMRRSAP
jgi:AraC-like DNA-binding protein